MRTFLFCVAASAALLANGVAWAEAPAIPAGAQPLGDAEILALLDGKSFAFTGYDQPIEGTTTWDSKDGSVTGTYVWEKTEKGEFNVKWFVKDGKNCTQELEKDPVCQTIYKLDNGFMEVNAEGAVHAVSVPAQ